MLSPCPLSTPPLCQLGLEFGEVPGWDDAALVRDLLDVMASSGADFTNTWRWCIGLRHPRACCFSWLTCSKRDLALV